VPVVTSSKPARPITARHEQGRSYLASLLNWWLRQSGLSHEQLSRLADWGGGEQGLLIPSAISHLRRSNNARGPSMRNLEGLGAANRAIWLWQTKGEAAAIKELGNHSSHKVDSKWLDGAIWLATAEDERLPLDVVDLVQLSVGLLELPYLQQTAISPSESRDLSERLSALLNELAGGGTPAEGIRRVLEAYPVTDPIRQRRLRDLLLGEPFTREELEHEMLSLAACVNRLRGLPDGTYVPADLHAELTQGRKRT
jgi:hypothetical protein